MKVYTSFAQLMSEILSYKKINEGMTQEAFIAELAGLGIKISRNTISKWVNGKILRPSVEHLKGLSKITGVQIDLLGSLSNGGKIQYDVCGLKGSLISEILPIDPKEDAEWINELFVRIHGRPEGCRSMEYVIKGLGIVQPIPSMNYKILNPWGENVGYTCSFYCRIDWMSIIGEFPNILRVYD